MPVSTNRPPEDRIIADRWIRIGFLAAGLVNVVGVLVFSKAFTNETLHRIDPVVMSNFAWVFLRNRG